MMKKKFVVCSGIGECGLECPHRKPHLETQCLSLSCPPCVDEEDWKRLRKPLCTASPLDFTINPVVW